MGLLGKLFGKSSGPPTKDKFAKLVQNGIRQAGETGKIVFDPEQFRLFIEGESGTKLYLGNIYTEYCSVPETTREATLNRAIRTWFTAEKRPPDEFEDARHDLLPAIRSRGYFGAATLMMQIDGNEPKHMPYQLLGDDLAIGLVYDLPESMRSIDQDDLDKWGVTFYEALEAARENLMQLQHSFIGPKEGEGVYLSMTHDNYDASRLLLLDIIRRMSVKGEAVAMIPNRDTLIVTGSDDEEGLKGMLALAKEALQQPRTISGIALRLDGDEWLSWMPEATHPLYQEFRTLQVQAIGQEYAEQKVLLDKLHIKRKQDIFTASYMAMETRDTGHLIPYCVWTKNVLALLPRTDRIAFMQEGKDPLMAAWDRVVEVVGDLMEPLDIYPERFKVREFPTEEQLAAMGAETP